MAFKDLVRQARSYRRFVESARLTRAELRDLVDVARLTPSGGNQQPLRYRLVYRKEECDTMFPFLAWAAVLKGWGGPAAGERPAAYIVILAESSQGANLGIAAQTIQLAASEMGYGACMLGAIQRDQIKAALHVPEQLGVQLVIALGKPAETIVLEDIQAGASLDYYRTADGVHHVPKLVADDLIVK